MAFTACQAIAATSQPTTSPASVEPPSRRELLHAFKTDQYFWEQEEVGEKLIALDDKSVIADMLPFLQSASRSERCNAGMVLAKLGDDRGFQAILAELNDTDDRPTNMTNDDGSRSVRGQIQQDRYYASRILGKIGDKRAVPPLIEWLKDKSLDYQAAIILGQLGDARAVPALKELLANGDEWQRLWSAYGLAKIGDPAGVPALMVFLTDKNPQWTNRRHAIRALEEVGDKRAVQALISALQDPSPDIRNAAADALGSIGDPSAIGALEALSGDTDTNTSGPPRAVRDAAAAAIRQLKNAREPATKSVSKS
jgi:HEAT repeat protein